MTLDKFFQAQSLHSDGDFAATETLLREVLDLEEKHVAAWRLCADSLHELGREDDAG